MLTQFSRTELLLGKEAMEKLKIRLEANVNFDIAMELMLLTIKENLK